jgi:hypothetical protein
MTWLISRHIISPHQEDLYDKEHVLEQTWTMRQGWILALQIQNLSKQDEELNAVFVQGPWQRQLAETFALPSSESVPACWSEVSSCRMTVSVLTQSAPPGHLQSTVWKVLSHHRDAHHPATFMFSPPPHSVKERLLYRIKSEENIKFAVVPWFR